MCVRYTLCTASDGTGNSWILTLRSVRTALDLALAHIDDKKEDVKLLMKTQNEHIYLSPKSNLTIIVVDETHPLFNASLLAGVRFKRATNSMADHIEKVFDGVSDMIVSIANRVK